MRVWRLRASIVFSALLFLYFVYLVEVVYTRIPDPYPIVSFEVSLFTISVYCLLVLLLLIITVYYIPVFSFFFPSIFQRWLLESS